MSHIRGTIVMRAIRLLSQKAQDTLTVQGLSLSTPIITTLNTLMLRGPEFIGIKPMQILPPAWKVEAATMALTVEALIIWDMGPSSTAYLLEVLYY
jgi:hypothetical protein